ncbi:MAG: hypothetical protein ABIU77_14695 [Ferruginibacter sp.]|jgi:hypothetical protein
MTTFKYLLIQCLLLLTVSTLNAQGNEMFIQQIQGKTIERENFNSSGNLTSKQQFVVGKINKSGNSLLINIQLKFYDETNKLTSSYATTYKCQPEESNVLLSVFSINPRKQKVKVSVTSGDFKNMYGLIPGEFPKTISLEMNIESGILNFLGSKNLVTIDNRAKTENSKQIIINSAMTIKAYLLGIRIKKIEYKVTEYLTRQGILEKQIFKENDGSYFNMNYQ